MPERILLPTTIGVVVGLSSTSLIVIIIVVGGAVYLWHHWGGGNDDGSNGNGGSGAEGVGPWLCSFKSLGDLPDHVHICFYLNTLMQSL